MLKQVIQEIVAVSRGRQIKLDEHVTDKVLAIIDQLPEETMASMQRDILEGRPSELGSQNGAVVRLGLEERYTYACQHISSTTACSRKNSEPGGIEILRCS
jgi:ketopantoate reductase